MSNDSFILESRGHAILLRCGCTIEIHSINKYKYSYNETQERVILYILDQDILHAVYSGSGYTSVSRIYSR